MRDLAPQTAQASEAEPEHVGKAGPRFCHETRREGDAGGRQVAKQRGALGARDVGAVSAGVVGNAAEVERSRRSRSQWGRGRRVYRGCESPCSSGRWARPTSLKWKGPS